MKSVLEYANKPLKRNQIKRNQNWKKYAPKKLSEVKKTTPAQASLFSLLTELDIVSESGYPSAVLGKNYSQTIELYDFMPRFVWQQQHRMREKYNGLLPALQRDFECRGIPFRMTMTAATLLARDGSSIAHYPGKDEDLLEMILRKMYIAKNPQFFDGQPGLTFTIRELRQEMKNQGHSRSHYEILKALRVLKGAGIECKNLRTNKVIAFSTIDVLSYYDRDFDSRRRVVDETEPVYLIFSKFLAEALENLYFRRFNYQKVVGYNSYLARLLHRRLSHHFTQADFDTPYTVNITTLIRDFGLKFENLSKALIEFDKAFEELRKADAVRVFQPKDENFPERAEIIVPRAKTYGAADPRVITEYTFSIYPTKSFSLEAINSNRITKNVQSYAEVLQAVGEEADFCPCSQKDLPGSGAIFPALVNKYSSRLKHQRLKKVKK